MAEQQAMPAPVARAIPRLGTPSPAPANPGGQRDEKRSASKTVTDTIIGAFSHPRIAPLLPIICDIPEPFSIQPSQPAVLRAEVGGVVCGMPKSCSPEVCH